MKFLEKIIRNICKMFKIGYGRVFVFSFTKIITRVFSRLQLILWILGTFSTIFNIFLQSAKQFLALQAQNQLRSKVVAQRCSVKKVVFEISKNSQENTCVRVSFFNKVAGLRHRCFPANFAKFLRIAFLTEHLRGMLQVNNKYTKTM